MKISDIVTVNMNKASNATFTNNTSSNSTAAIIALILRDSNNAGKSDDLIWRSYRADEVSPEVVKAANVYFNNGGRELLVKELYYETAEEMVDSKIRDAIRGSDSHTGLRLDVINVMLVGNDALIIGQAAAIMSKINAATEENVDGEVVKRPEEEKIILINIKKELMFVEGESGLTPIAFDKELDNLFINIYEDRASGSGAIENNYEMALAAAYMSKINYGADTIRGFEYTVMNGQITNINTAKQLIKGSTRTNMIAELAGRYLAIGAQMVNGDNFLGKYFTIVLTQRITSALAELTISKLNFENRSYALITSALNATMDVFRTNQLLNTEFVVEKDVFVNIETASGTEAQLTIEKGEVLEAGYKVFTLLPSTSDLRTKTYSGAHIYFAINNQIRKMNVSGLVLGGI